MLHRNESAGIYPNDLALLKRVFDKLCCDNGYRPDSPEAEATAVRLLGLFQSGWSSEQALLEACQPRTQLKMTG